MNNLLIFVSKLATLNYTHVYVHLQAGLFSAVVTAFAAVSLQSLQPDDTQTSVQLLAGISRQLASFTITPEFMNSSAPSVEPSASPFAPTRLAVQVNTLWFLSLALSLIAALFAIAAQQWLRHLRLPPHLAARTALKLRQLRYESLRVWQVPGIISLLPMLL